MSTYPQAPQVFCPRCRGGNPPGATYCMWCRQALPQVAPRPAEVRCPYCQGGNPPGAPVCMWCRRPLGMPGSRPPGPGGLGGARPATRRGGCTRPLILLLILGLGVFAVWRSGWRPPFLLPASGPDPATLAATQQAAIDAQLTQVAAVTPRPGRTPVPGAGFGTVAATTQAPIAADRGGAVTLPDGARLTIPAGAIGDNVAVQLVRAAVPAVAQQRDLYTDVYYAAADARPLFGGGLTLAIPYDPARLPPNVPPESLQAYVLFNGNFLYPARSRVDTAHQQIIVEQADVTVLGAIPGSGGSVARIGLGAPAFQASVPATGYVGGGPPILVVPAAPEPPAGTCVRGAPGETLAKPGQAFEIVFEAQSTCAFGEFVADRLQEAYTAYNKTYAFQNGGAPLAVFSPDNRMAIYLTPIGEGVNGEYEYQSWNGYINVDPVIGEANLENLRNTLYHELFHAMQNRYRDMLVAGVRGRWWMEATAERAALALRGQTLAQAIHHSYDNYGVYMLSVPIQESGPYEANTLAYGYAMLIDYAERQTPGYVRDTLNKRDVTSSQGYYDTLTAALHGTYPDFVKTILVEAVGRGGRDPWLEGRVLESNAETRLYRPAGSTYGALLTGPQRISDVEERAKPQRFAGTAGPLTTHFFAVQATGLTKRRGVQITLLQNGAASLNAWLLTVPAGSAPSAQAPPTRLSARGGKVTGFGSQVQTIWIAVFNPDTTNSATYDLAITLNAGDDLSGTTWRVYWTKDGSSTLYGDLTFDAGKPGQPVTAHWPDPTEAGANLGTGGGTYDGTDFDLRLNNADTGVGEHLTGKMSDDGTRITGTMQTTGVPIIGTLDAPFEAEQVP